MEAVAPEAEADHGETPRDTAADHGGPAACADASTVAPGCATAAYSPTGGTGGQDGGDRALVPVGRCQGWRREAGCGRPIWSRGYCSTCYPRWRADQIAAGAWPLHAKHPERSRRISNEEAALRMLMAYRTAEGHWPSGHDLVAWCPPDVRRPVAAGLLAMLNSGRVEHFVAPVGATRRHKPTAPPRSAGGWLEGRPVDRGWHGDCAIEATENVPSEGHET